MHICLDARLYGLKHAGIGRYVKNLLDNLSEIDTDNQYTIITSPTTKIDKIPKHSKILVAQERHYSIAEQTTLLLTLNSIEADIFHFPHFNVPLFFRKPYVVTIHDLLWHEKRGTEVTTLSPWVYHLKYLAYRLIIRNTAKKAIKVLTPTNHVAKQVRDTFDLNPNKVIVTYEAADQIFHQKHKTDNQTLDKYKLKRPFIVYIGSLYPHKNVISVVKALKQVKNCDLVVSSARNIFSQRFSKQVAEENMQNRVHVLDFASDEDIIQLYLHGLALVLPSQSEGFGLTGLEAMATGVPVICSDQPVLREIYKDSALFVDTLNIEALAEVISRLKKDKKLQNKLKSSAQKTSHMYSWEKMANETLSVYRDSVR